MASRVPPFATYEMRYTQPTDRAGVLLALIDGSAPQDYRAFVSPVPVGRPFDWRAIKLADPNRRTIQSPLHGGTEVPTLPLPWNLADDFYLADALEQCAFQIRKPDELVRTMIKTFSTLLESWGLDRKTLDLTHDRPAGSEMMGALIAGHPSLAAAVATAGPAAPKRRGKRGRTRKAGGWI
jgi:hypothetical protein